MQILTLVFSAIAAAAALVGMILAVRAFLTEDRGRWDFEAAGSVAARGVRLEVEWIGPGAAYDVELTPDPGSQNTVMGPERWGRVDADSGALTAIYRPIDDDHKLTGATLTWKSGTQRWRRTRRTHVEFS